MYKAVKKNKAIQSFMEALALYNGAPTLHLEDDTSCIYGVEAKRVQAIFEHIYIKVYFLQEKFENGLFVTNCEKSSNMPEDMRTKQF